MANNENETVGAAAATPENGKPSSPVKPSDWRIILIGIYLLILMVGGLYFLGALMTAKKELNPSDTIITVPKSEEPAANNAVNSNAAVNSVARTTAITNANANSSVPTNVNTAVNTNGANSNLQVIATLPAETPAKSESMPETTVPREVNIPVVGVANPVNLTSDGYIFLIVLFAGILGAATRCGFSFFKHLGRGDFKFSWSWYYFFLPFGGGALALVIYFVIRGGFYSSAVGKDLSLNLFSFAALAALTGLFSENAMKKLKEIAEMLLAKSNPNPDDPKGDGNGN